MSRTIFLVGAAVMLALTAFSQSTDSTKTTVLDEVTVTANKIQQKQSQTGKVVTIINKAQIEKSQGKTLGQLLNEQAGLSINGALNNLGTNQGVYMRGANIGRTLILVDGVPAYDPSFINGETDLNFFSIANIERIEIARGAQSTLYGSDAIAGVINIITNKSDVTKPVQGNVGAAFGSFNTFRGNAQVYGKTKTLDYSVRYAKLRSDGFSSANDKTGNKNFDNDGYNGDAVQATLNIKATNHFEIKPYIQYSHYKTDLDNGAFTDDKDYTNTNTNKLAGTRLQYKTGSLQVVGQYMYGENERNYRDDSTDVPGFVKYATNDFAGKSHFAELYANWQLAKGWNLLAGADFRQASMNSRYFSISSFGPYKDSFADTSLRQGSVYASLMYQHKNWNLEGGIRWNSHQRYGSNATFTFNPSYSINQQWRVFGSIASGFKAPSIYQLYSAFGNKDLDAEKSINYELGVQQGNAKWSNRLVYFYRDIQNGIDFDNINYSYFNISQQRVQGLELESKWQLAKALQFTLNYTYLLPDETVQSRITFKDTSYNYLLRRPRHQLHATLGWQITEKLFASVNAKYVSDRYDVGGYKKPDVKLDAYFLLGAYAEYRVGKWGKLYADFQNITNKQFFDINGFNSIPFMINAGFQVHL